MFPGRFSTPRPLAQQKLYSNGKRSCVLCVEGRKQPKTLRRFVRHSNLLRWLIIRVAHQIGPGQRDIPGQNGRTFGAFPRIRAHAIHDSPAARTRNESRAAEAQVRSLTGVARIGLLVLSAVLPNIRPSVRRWRRVRSRRRFAT